MHQSTSGGHVLFQLCYKEIALGLTLNLDTGQFQKSLLCDFNYPLQRVSLSVALEGGLPPAVIHPISSGGEGGGTGTPQRHSSGIMPT